MGLIVMMSAGQGIFLMKMTPKSKMMRDRAKPGKLMIIIKSQGSLKENQKRMLSTTSRNRVIVDKSILDNSLGPISRERLIATQLAK